METVDFNPKNITHMVFNLTNQCNLRCKYCFTEHNPRKMSLDTLKQAILFGVNTCGVKRGTFFGGEPMLEYETLIKPIVKWVEEEKIPITFGMTTNGTHFTDERLQWLKDHKIGFLLSIDGDKDTQDYNRPQINGKGSFDLVNPYIDKIIELFPNTTFRSTVTPYSGRNVVKDYLYARKKGFRYYYLIPDCLNFKWTEEDLSIFFKNYANILEIMYRDITVGILPLEISQFIKSLQKVFPYYYDKNFPQQQATIYRCGLGTTSIGVSPEGYLSGCQEHCTYKEDSSPFYIGDIYNGFDKERQEKLWSYILNKSTITNKNHNCKECPSRKMCSAQFCPGHNWLNNQDLTISDDISCKWQVFQNGMSMILLDKAARENNGLFLEWLLDRLKTNNYS